MKKKMPKEREKFWFKPKHTDEDIDMIRRMKKGGSSRGDIFYVMMQRRSDVSPITIGRWIDKVREGRK